MAVGLASIGSQMVGTHPAYEATESAEIEQMF